MADTTSFLSKVSDFGGKVKESIIGKGSVKDTLASSSAVKSVTDAGKTAGKAFMDATGLVQDQSKSDQKPPKEPEKIKAVTEKYELVHIGKPSNFTDVHDEGQRFGNYLKSKMSVIDLIPVDYHLKFDRMAQQIKENTPAEKGSSAIADLFGIGYDVKMKLYKKICKHHGLKEYAGIRLYTTDDSTANDTINVTYKDSWFKQGADKLTEFGQTLRDLFMSSTGTMASDLTPKINERVKTFATEAGEGIGIANHPILALLSEAAGVVTDVVLGGNKLTFPKIWQDTTYNGHLSINIRLVSPYGHPAAVKEFILKPLAYLIILAAPSTTTGITFGQNIPLTIKAYGLNFTTVGAISSMTFRRGGNETSFNLYRQPLTVDVSIDFQTLYDAFAVVANDALDIDKDIFADSSLFGLSEPKKQGLYDLASNESNQHMMTTLGTIMTSFKPVHIFENMYDPQVYGYFVTPTKTIPGIPPFTPLTGNLGSTISSAVSSVANFGNMIANSPKLLQQGLSNAVYNVSKGAVSSVTSAAKKTLNPITGNLNNTVSTVLKNIF